MRITIIGWYGTETIGDRAILAGIISICNNVYESLEISLGSLYPYFSDRTLNEDYDFYKNLTQKDIKINIFNSTKPKELVNAIKKSDLIAMGGGPLMDVRELYLVEYAFKKAKKLGKKTALLGCGIGPLFNKEFKKSVINIVTYSDIVILRDSKSVTNLKEIILEFNHSTFDVDYSYDPAVECALRFNELNSKRESDYICFNLREFPVSYSNTKIQKDIDRELTVFLEQIARKYATKEIKLLPMHYFHKGTDDRVFLNKIAFDLKLDNINVQNPTLTLSETMEVYQQADINIGMRFHSVVLQTIVSGKNFVLDYTEPYKGKISGFINDIDCNSFYADRYLNLQSDDIDANIIKDVEKRFEIDKDDVYKRLDVYSKKLKGLVN
ncbi:polysaccharide pyruvyl transferase family protein [Carboxylicivirga marina]|uniref:Polysaccharide pyruvyl transferase family protein n=1 Tax=Carboxylicivirga marina TaxID=2800988 RepID=A0ABS1HK05_9BACT|nr:polysaccharide pyruvyl transferase family protein [Carboxylicivirga marina]MBK3518009.1 polysaccharide pyruvyl transferase family protein [Carboxylicivirga marina]